MTAIISPGVATYGAGSTMSASPFGPARSTEAALFRVVHACEKQRKQFEDRVGIDNILAVMEAEVPTPAVEASIDIYRNVIRQNAWNFPKIEGVLGNVSLFFSIWLDVHEQYYDLATDIFDMIVTYGIESLVNPTLYAEVIRSETARGWVGKRSVIGPDQQIEKRASRVEELLGGLMPLEDVDQILNVGGALPCTAVLRSAEEDMTGLLSVYANLDDDGTEDLSVRNRLLRDYSKYSVKDLDQKVAAYRQSFASAGAPESRIAPDLDALLGGLPLPLRAETTELLGEIQSLNVLNLNLEPRFSFKSWAGLMHGLVFSAVRELPGTSTDVYRNLNTLKEKQ
ncbi:MAG TPA: hypothetical protein PLQ19_06555 [Aeromicrobium sp.]|nr:hypothetical protein [Aeromicrobium sp.]